MKIKKSILQVASLICVISFASCTNNDPALQTDNTSEVVTETTSDIEIIGTPLQTNNISNGGEFCIENGVIFQAIRDSENDYGITRTVLDGMTTKIYNGFASSLNIVDGWIYFTTEKSPWEGNGIKRVKIDGANEQAIYNAKSSTIYVADNTIYALDNRNIQKISLTGKTEEINCPEEPIEFIVDDNWIYYLDQGTNYMFRIDIDGNNRQEVLSENVLHFNVYGNNIYYISYADEDNFKLYKIDLDGKNKEKIVDHRCTAVNVTKDWIYYCYSDDDGKISYLNRASHDAKTVEKISNVLTEGYIAVAGNKVYVRDSFDHFKLKSYVVS